MGGIVLFECKGTINPESLNEIKKHMLAPRQKIFFACMMALSVCLIGLSIFIWSLTYILLSAALFCAFLLEYLFMPRFMVKTMLKRIREISDKNECEYAYMFDDSGIKVTNLDTNGTATMRYDIIKRFVETENYFALVTRARQFTIINKNSCDRDELLACIRRNCPNVKV